MTLGQCLEEIRMSFLGGSRELMSKVGMNLIREIKRDYYPNGDFPRTGWLLLTQWGESVRLSNGEVHVELDLGKKASQISGGMDLRFATYQKNTI